MAAEDPTPIPPAPPRRLLRSRTDRVLGGVCGGLARFTGLDPVVVRVGAVAVALLTGGLGVLAYLAALLLVPAEPAAGETLPAAPGPGRAVTVGGLVVLGLLLLVIGPGVGLAGLALVPLAVLALFGLGAWWLASGGQVGDTPGAVAASVALGIGLLVLSGVVGFLGAWAAAAGGGVVASALVVGAGVALVAADFVRPLRALILPALALTLSVGFVAAAGIDLRGGIGAREYRPASGADVRDGYRIGAGRLVVDLRDVPPAELARRTVDVGVGMGEAFVLVPDGVCVASRGTVGVGVVANFDRESGGLDVDVDDGGRPVAGSALLTLDADVGLGQVQVGRQGLAADLDDPHPGAGPGPGDRFDWRGGEDLRASANPACAGAL